MDVEETKKIIQNKIEAEAVTKDVRRQIKSYIHEKQNVREGFKDTFKPLIESQDKVKESIDNQQIAMIKQLRENQLALTEGLDKNRLAITQGFDKMDDVKKWDLLQLPGYEAIEEEKETEEKETQASEEPKEAKIKISHRNLNKISRYDMYPDDDIQIKMNKRDFKKFLENNRDLVKKYEITLDEFTGEIKVKDKPITLSYGESDMDKNLINTVSNELLKSYELELPSYNKDKSLKEIQEAFRKSHEILIAYKDALKNTATYDIKSDPGKVKAVAVSLEPSAKTRNLIREHHIMEDYNYNLNLLREHKKN